jgi:TetR/AcrR family transcriptional regulator, ethionamide resistance regulator
MPKRALRPSADRILVAAEQLFATKGYADVSLRQLMAAAGVSTTAFYARFDSKDAVLDTLTERLFADLQAEAATKLARVKSFEEGIERGVDILCDRFAARRALVRLVIAESGSVAPTSSIRKKSYAMLVAFLAHYLRALSQRGRIDVADPESMAWALVGALEMQIVRWAVWDELDVEGLRAQLLAVARAILPVQRPAKKERS